MPQLRLPTPRFLIAGSILVCMIILAGCGGSATMSAATSSNSGTSSMSSGSYQTYHQAAAGVNGANKSIPVADQQAKMPTNAFQQHLIKTLNITMEAKDTRQVADDIQTWIGNTDPQAVSIGTNYNQISDGVYSITVSYSVQATLYPKISNYLSNYPLKDGGHLLSLNENVQDVTNDYVDTEARIKTAQIELQRLRGLVQTAGSLNDILTLDQRISDVEGNIEATQAHLNLLNNQTTMYTINLTIQPIGSATPPIQANSGWNIGQTMRDALTASLAFAQALLSFIIWLLAFSVYIIPVILLIVLYRRYQARHRPARPVYYQPTGPNGPMGSGPVPPQRPVTRGTVPPPDVTGNRSDPVEEVEAEKVPESVD